MAQGNDAAPEILDLPIGLDATGIRAEFDSLGQVEVPADQYWGAQTQRSLQHFSVGHDKMPAEVYHAYGYVKKAAAAGQHPVRPPAGMDGPAHPAGLRRDHRGRAGPRVPAARVPDRLGHPLQHERERGHRQPLHPAGRRHTRLAAAGASQRSRQHGPVEQRHVPDRDAHRRLHHGYRADDPRAARAAGRDRRQRGEMVRHRQDRPDPSAGRHPADRRPGVVRVRRRAGRRDRGGRARHARPAATGHGRDGGRHRPQRAGEISGRKSRRSSPR